MDDRTIKILVRIRLFYSALFDECRKVKLAVNCRHPIRRSGCGSIAHLRENLFSSDHMEKRQRRFAPGKNKSPDILIYNIVHHWERRITWTLLLMAAMPAWIWKNLIANKLHWNGIDLTILHGKRQTGTLYNITHYRTGNSRTIPNST